MVLVATDGADDAWLSIDDVVDELSAGRDEDGKDDEYTSHTSSSIPATVTITHNTATPDLEAESLQSVPELGLSQHRIIIC